MGPGFESLTAYKEENTKCFSLFLCATRPLRPHIQAATQGKQEIRGMVRLSEKRDRNDTDSSPEVDIYFRAAVYV